MIAYNNLQIRQSKQGFVWFWFSMDCRKNNSFIFSLQFAGAEKFQPLGEKRAICGTCWAFRMWKVNLHISPAKILWPCLWRDHSGAARPPGTHILLAKHCETRLYRLSMYPGFEASSALCPRSQCFSIGGSLLGIDSQFILKQLARSIIWAHKPFQSSPPGVSPRILPTETTPEKFLWKKS